MTFRTGRFRDRIDWIDEFIFGGGFWSWCPKTSANLVNRSTPIAFVATGKYWVNNHAHILRPPDNNLAFWAERIESIDLFPFVTGSAQPKLTAEALNNLMIAVPRSYAERAAIQEHFVALSKSLDALIAEAQRAIDLLQERRTALISAAVTGKIDVRGMESADNNVATTACDGSGGWGGMPRWGAVQFTTARTSPPQFHPWSSPESEPEFQPMAYGLAISERPNAARAGTDDDCGGTRAGDGYLTFRPKPGEARIAV